MVDLGTASSVTQGQKGILQEREPQTGVYNYNMVTFG